MNAIDPTPPRVRHARRIGFIAWGTLLVLQLAWYAWLAPPAHMPVAAALGIALVPLLLPALALRRPPRALLLAGMVALFYFCHGISEAWTNPAVRGLAFVEIALTLVLIGALGAAVQKRQKPAPANPA
jgi:uncharacterized membrane protein